MPFEMDEADKDGPSDRGRSRKNSEAPHSRWWRPASTVGRVLLGSGVITVVAIFAVSAFALKNFLERDGRFRIAGTSNLQATGLSEVNRSEMLPVFGEDVGRNIFFVPLAERRKQLEQIPWIEHATVMRLLPDQIRVSVVERRPVAFLRQGQRIGLVDSNGVLLSMPAAAMSQHHYSFPVVTGIDGRDPLTSRRNRMTVYLRLLGELDANGKRLSDQISEIDLTDPEDARVLMPEQGTDIVAHFGEDNFLERYQRYKAHIAEWRQQYPRLAEVDLRYEQQVVLQMTPGSNSAPATLNATDGKLEEAKAVKPPAPAKAAPSKHAQSSKPAKAHLSAKPFTKPSTKSKAAKNKPAQKKKHADALPRRAASLHPNKSNPVPVSAMGQ
jgi:cell division protein FtsQ